MNLDDPIDVLMPDGLKKRFKIKSIKIKEFGLNDDEVSLEIEWPEEYSQNYSFHYCHLFDEYFARKLPK